MYNKLLKSPRLAKFQELISEQPSLLIENLWDAPKAALLLLATHALKKSIVFITAKESLLLSDLDYFGFKDALDLPSWETLPGEEIAPSPDIVGKRFEVFHQLLIEKKPHLLFCTLQSCLQKQLPPSSIKELCKMWKVGETRPFDQIEKELTALGYKRRPIASDKGEFALRGGIVDLFPLSAPQPFRIDFFGDTIDQIRTFDPIGQKSTGKVDHFLLSPASELDLLKKQKQLASIFDFVGKDYLVVFDDLLALENSYVSLSSLPAAKSSLFSTMEELFKEIKGSKQLYLTKERVEELSHVQMPKKVGRSFYTGENPLQPLSFEIFNQTIETERFAHPFEEIASFFTAAENRAAISTDELLHSLQRFPTLDLHLIATSAAEEQSLKERLKDQKLPKETSFERGYLSSGFVVTDSQLALLPTTELTHRMQIRRQKWRQTYHTPPSDFHELQIGDIVVHFHNGIGKYLGSEKRLNHLGKETEFLLVEFAENGKLYVPISQSHLVSKYIGAEEEVPTLSTLGSTRWQHTRIKAEKAVVGYAQDLLRLNAERTVHGGFHFPPDSAETRAFAEAFPFVETEDQLQAIEEIKSEMCSQKAMDRLVCGDVGYGKTEVAMRAAFKAVCDGKKQVAVLVPTTILAMQHFETFQERMADFPLNIGVLSRFRSPKEIKETLKKVESGAIDIVIGTHRMVSQDVHFKDLGLIIIDEEQRFGVRAKEHLKKLKVGVDCLTLSATPIPRTLYLSLVGAKEVSMISTPPQDRLPIKTILSQREPATIQNALLRELSRGGQAYFIHNRVETLSLVQSELQKLLPQARIVSAHGQMPSEEIDTLFHSFKSGETDILIATTIVENGIDIPNANTILIDRADRFGLADLYQLRGRVGRWNRPAYAYFLVPTLNQLPDIARKRLHALLEASGFGGGVKVAMRDLEIRGAGDILGVKQSGQISSVGFHLYCKLLRRAIDALKKNTTLHFCETKMEFAYPASLPESYISEVSLRMEIYHRLGEASQNEEVDAILSELQDRFGAPPQEVIWLYHLTRLRLFASAQQFTLLKFDKLTFLAERQCKKEVERKLLRLPEIKKPADVETKLIPLLKSSFV